MLTKKQLDIFGSFIGNIFREYTYKELKELSMEKSNNAMHIAIKKLKDENLVKERKVGNSCLYKLNIENDTVFEYIYLFNESKLPKLAGRYIRILKEEIKKYTAFYSIVIFGSYSVGKQKKDSDLDIAIFIEDKSKNDYIKTAVNSAEDKSLIPPDAHVITQDEFLEMLKVDYENVGKEIARKHLAMHNPMIFYSLLMKGVKNGFRL